MKDLELSDKIDPRDLAVLENGLASNAIAHGAPPYVPQDLVILKRDETGKLVAGFTGYTVWNWLYVDILWVDEPLRGQGMGAALMRAAEAEAQRRGCHDAYLWTEDFEGTSFYPKLGYHTFVVKPAFPDGFTRTGFMKRIAT